jgi:hypothetical protein
LPPCEGVGGVEEELSANAEYPNKKTTDKMIYVDFLICNISFANVGHYGAVTFFLKATP